MSNGEIHVGNIGTEFRLIIESNDEPLDISLATVKQIHIKKPDGSILIENATFYTNGTDGIIYYRAQSGDLDQPGSYKIQGFVQIAGGTYYSNIRSFPVKCNL